MNIIFGKFFNSQKCVKKNSEKRKKIGAETDLGYCPNYIVIEEIVLQEKGLLGCAMGWEIVLQ